MKAIAKARSCSPVLEIESERAGTFCNLSAADLQQAPVFLRELITLTGPGSRKEKALAGGVRLEPILRNGKRDATYCQLHNKNGSLWEESLMSLNRTG